MGDDVRGRFRRWRGVVATLLVVVAVAAVGVWGLSRYDERLGRHLRSIERVRAARRTEPRYPFRDRYLPTEIPYDVGDQILIGCRLGPWRERVERTMLLDRLDEDWLERGTPPVGPIDLVLPDDGLEHRDRHMMRALHALAWALAEEGKPALAYRTILVTLTAARQAAEAGAQRWYMVSMLGVFHGGLLNDRLKDHEPPSELCEVALARIEAVERFLFLPRDSNEALARWVRGRLEASATTEVDPAVVEALVRNLPTFHPERCASWRELCRAQAEAEAALQSRPSLAQRLLAPRSALTLDLALYVGRETLRSSTSELGVKLQLRNLALRWAASRVHATTGSLPRSWEDLGGLVPERLRRDPGDGGLLTVDWSGDRPFLRSSQDAGPVTAGPPPNADRFLGRP